MAKIDPNKPATQGDIAASEQLLKGEVQQSENRLRGELQQSEKRVMGELQKSEGRMMRKLVSKKEWREELKKLATKEELYAVRDSLEHKIELLANQVATNTLDIRELKDKVNDMDVYMRKNFELMFQNFDFLIAKMDTMIAEQAAFNRSLDRHDRRLDDHETRIGNLERKTSGGQLQ